MLFTLSLFVVLLSVASGDRSLDSLIREDATATLQYLSQVMGLQALRPAMTLEQIARLNPSPFIFSQDQARFKVSECVCVFVG